MTVSLPFVNSVQLYSYLLNLYYVISHHSQTKQIRQSVDSVDSVPIVCEHIE